MANYISIHQLLSTSRSADVVIACSKEQEKNWNDWLSDVQRVHDFFVDQNETVFALYENDTYRFLVFLFGLWAAKKTVCVPGSNQTSVVHSIKEYVQGYAGDFVGVESAHWQKIITSDTAKNTSVEINSDQQCQLQFDLDPSALALQVFTSGSSGDPELIPKHLYQLIEEIDNIHRVWEKLGRDATVYSTVSHHHIYGLLFRALWPLAEGNQFDTAICEFFEDVGQRSDNVQKIVLVSSPTHLSRISKDTDWSLIKNKCVGVFSSGAPLPAPASFDAAKYFGCPPYEVFGSSETGGIAWRQQSPTEDVRWQPFPGIEVAIDESSQCLKILSPYLPPIESEGNAKASKDVWYVTQDKIQFDEGSKQFKLLGRADNIVKVEGKRVSVTEMERKLIAHEGIKAAKTVVLTNEKNNRVEIGVVLVLSEQGEALQAQLSRFQFNKQLQNYLLDFFERPVVPRRWRIVEELPFNSQGKITQKSLLDFFKE